MNLPGTSRGVLENCMNENTENSRIEDERLQSESVNKNGKTDESNMKKCESQNDCDTNKIINENDATKEDTNNVKNVSKQNASSSKNAYVIERTLSTSTPSSSSSAPSCSRVVTSRLCDFQSNTQDDSRRQGRKRRNDSDKDNSSSDDDSNKSMKRHVKVLLLDKKIPNADSSSNIPNIRVQVPMENNDSAQPSTSGFHRNTLTTKAMEDPTKNNNPPAVVIQRDRDVTDFRQEVDRVLRASLQDPPEIHRDANENPYRIFRLNRTIGNIDAR